jgi:hypothetical protein
MKKPLIEIQCSSVRKDGGGAFTISIDVPTHSIENEAYSCRASSEAIDFRIDAWGRLPQDAVKNALLLTALRVGHALGNEITDVFETEDYAFD